MQIADEEEVKRPRGSTESGYKTGPDQESKTRPRENSPQKQQCSQENVDTKGGDVGHAEKRCLHNKAGEFGDKLTTCRKN